ncbi:acyltransferase family protein [Frigoribacterium faeni]|uniref:Acyltransferase n=1 Tax=Frigoribacterium faeni TaxID=145483 RepID=A0A7W3PIW3_9MICO|nr:acyltransferase [Frigoribacterium faeni]MBA8813341.1 peptidoglycan/LPS O-acetylase OafA/YrhL [Frigoribacterium faeni]GEK84695.1 acyltransferase [Frigoribacterium faeni]
MSATATTPTPAGATASSNRHWGDRIVGLEGLRGLAAMAVLAYHVAHVLTRDVEDETMPLLVFLMHQGLSLFFVLSGFLLFWPFATRIIEGRELPSLRRYTANRFLRIWPAYVVVFLIVNFGLRMSFLSQGEFGQLPWWKTLVDLTLLHSYLPGTLRTGLEVSWTLTVELTFYLVLPFLAMLGRRVAARTSGWIGALVPVGVMFVAGVAGKIWQHAVGRTSGLSGGDLSWSDNWFSVVSRSLLLHADLFAFGMAAALLYIAVRRGSATPVAVSALRGALMVIIGAAFVVAWIGSSPEFQDTFASIGFTGVLLLMVLPAHVDRLGWIARFCDWAPIRNLGVISFSVYLWHMPVIRIMQDILDPGHGGRALYAWYLVVTVTITLVLATATYWLVEKQALRFKPQGKPSRGGGPAGLGATAPGDDVATGSPAEPSEEARGGSRATGASAGGRPGA